MKRLYLDRVELSNFRVYGDSFTLDLPNGPGVTVIRAPNGLGKTTLFDAIEWGLTGTVSRFRPYLGDGRRKHVEHLTRFGALAGTHRVSLYFGEETPIDRGLGVQPGSVEIAEFLKEPNWPKIGDLARYLSITHFLGQSAAQRFSVKTPKEQWEALKGPAGVDRINLVKDRIGGQAARRAVNRALNSATELIERAQAELADWEQLLADRNRMRQLSLSVDALSSDAVVEQCAQLAAELRAISLVADWEPYEASETAAARLGALRKICTDVSKRLAEAQAKIERLVRVCVDFDAVRADLRATAALQLELQQSHSATADVVHRASTDLEMADSERKVAQRNALDAKARLQALSRIATAAEAFRTSTEQWLNVGNDIQLCDAKLADLQQQQSELADEVAAMRGRLERRRDITETIERARAHLELAAQLQRVNSDIESARAAGDPRAKLDDCVTRRAGLAADQDDVEAEIGQVTLQLREIDERMQAIAAAAATIAARLSFDDRQCPVCQTEFPVGALVQLAQAQRALSDSGAQQLGERLAELQIQRDAIHRDMTALDAEVVEWYSRVTQLQVAEGAAADLANQILDAGLTDSAQALETSIAHRLRELEAARAALDTDLIQGPPLEDLIRQLAETDVAVRAENARRAARAQVRADLSIARETAQALLLQHPDLWSLNDGLTPGFAELNNRAATAAAASAEALNQQEADVLRLRDQLEIHQRELAARAAAYEIQRAHQTELARREEELRRSWTASGMTGEPDAGAIRQEEDRLMLATRTLEQTEGRLTDVAEAYRRWLHDRDLAEREAQVQARIAAVGAADELEMDALLRENVRQAELQLARVGRFRTSISKVITRLQAEADQYAEQVLRPLNDTIRDFGRVLMTRADGSVFYRAEHHANRSELRPSLIWSDTSGATQHVEINPNLFFSEGQLSALSVSALLAASTSFPWSRWRAVLLDDPLQHNDVIHASAFADLIRQMVMHLGYQVVLSTHDSTEAAFLMRKCQSANIPFRLYELHSGGKDGTVWLQ